MAPNSSKRSPSKSRSSRSPTKRGRAEASELEEEEQHQQQQQQQQQQSQRGRKKKSKVELDDQSDLEKEDLDEAPPLSPADKVQEEEKAVAAQEETPQPVKRKRGRPPSAKKAEKPAPTPKRSGFGDDDDDSNAATDLGAPEEVIEFPGDDNMDEFGNPLEGNTCGCFCMVDVSSVSLSLFLSLPVSLSHSLSLILSLYQTGFPIPVSPLPFPLCAYLSRSSPLGKELRLKAFILPDRHPEKLYAMVLDLARVTGHGDSFRFYKAHPTVPKTYLSPPEREILVGEGLVHPIMKYRRVPILSVVSCYKRFGNKILRVQRKPKSELTEEQRKERLGMEIDMDYDRMAIRKSLTAQADVARRNAEAIALLKDLKPAAPIETPGADWIYQCAVATAGYNARLKMDRHDRLWGPIREFEGHGTDVDSTRTVTPMEDVPPELMPGRNDRDVVFKQGYYDMHTNMNQVPESTQYQNLRVESLGMSIKDLHKRVANVQEPKKTVEIQLDIAPTMPPSGIAPSANAIFGEQMGSRNNVQVSEFPLAIMPGQFQEVFSA